MNGINDITTFLIASILLTLMPGPDIIFVVSQSIAKGFKSGYIFAIGLCTGLIAHTAAVGLGVSVLLNESPTLFNILKYLGVAYLIYLGVITILHAKESNLEVTHARELNNKKLYVRGILMNILNPKVSLFFLAFLPQFIDPATSRPGIHMIFLGLLFIIQALIVFFIIAAVSGKLASYFIQSAKYGKWIAYAESAIFIGVAIWLLFH